MKSATGKRPPDEAHGPGKEAIRPHQRCLRKSRKDGAHGHAALPAEVGTTLNQKIKPFAPLQLQYFSKIVSNFFAMFGKFSKKTLLSATIFIEFRADFNENVSKFRLKPGILENVEKNLSFG